MTRARNGVRSEFVTSASKTAAGLTLGVLAVSSAATFVLLAAPLPPLVVAAGRVLVTGALLLALGVRDVRAFVRKLAAHPWLARRVALAGLLLAVHFGAWIASLTMTSVLRSTALVATQPVFAGVLGRVLGDRVSPRLYWGAAVSMGGVVVLASSGAAADEGSMAGDALALLGAVAVASYLAVGRSVRDALPLSAYLGAVHWFAAGLLCAAVWVTGPTGSAFSTGSAWLAVLYLGVVPGVVGHGLFNWAVRRAPVHVVSLAILAEPVGATVLAALLLDRSVTPLEIVGAGVLLVGVGVGLPGRGSPSPSSGAPSTEGQP